MSFCDILKKAQQIASFMNIDGKFVETELDDVFEAKSIIDATEQAVSYYKEGLKSNDINTQIKCFNNAIEVDPDYVEALYSLAMAYKRTGDQVLTIQYLRIAYEKNKTYQDICKQLAYNSFREKSYCDAIMFFNNAIKLTSYDYEKAEMYAHLACCYYNLESKPTPENDSDVVRSLISSYRLDPTVSCKLYANTFKDKIWFEVIENCFDYDSKIHGSKETFLSDKYWRHGLRSDREETKIKCIKKSIEIKPDHLQSHYSLGCYYKKNNQVSDAIYHFLQIEKYSSGYEDTRKLLHELTRFNGLSGAQSDYLIDYIISLLDENKKLDSTITAQQIDIEQKKHLLSGLTDLCQNHEIDLDDLKRENKQLKLEIYGHISMHDEVKRQLDELQSKPPISVSLSRKDQEYNDLKRDNSRLNSELTTYISKYNELKVKFETLETKQSLPAAFSNKDREMQPSFLQPTSKTHLKKRIAEDAGSTLHKSKYLFRNVEIEQGEVPSLQQMPEQTDLYEDIKI